MGNITRFGLPPYRRGLYGSSSPTMALYYGDQLKEPWIMKIKIHDSCRTHAFDVFKDTGNNSSFLNWVKTKSKLTADQINHCTYFEVDKIYWNSGEDFGSPEDLCQKVLNEYFDAANIQLVVDSAWPDSYYIRDRNCIEDITGTAQDLLSDLLQNPILLKTYLRQEGGLPTLIFIFKRILTEIPNLNRSILLEIQCLINSAIADQTKNEPIDYDQSEDYRALHTLQQFVADLL